MLTLRLAAAQTADFGRRAAYLTHASDEAHHARMFQLAAQALAREGQSLAPLKADAEDLFAQLGERRFLAFLYHAERRGRHRFELYSDLFERRGDSKRQALFHRIAGDERRHEQEAWRLLVSVAGSEKGARREVRRARAWEAWRAWRRAGRTIAECTYTLSVTTLYLLLFPLALVTRRVRPARSGFLSAPNRERDS